MNIVKWCFLLLASTTAWAQNGESSAQYDPEIQNLINKVEGPSSSGEVESLVKPETDLERELNEVFLKYWTAMANNNQMAVYEMMSSDYQKVISLTSHLKRKRLSIHKGQINSVETSGDDCALAIGYIWGNSSNLGDNLRIPIKVIMFKEQGDWRVYKNPYENAMGLTLPGSKKFKRPCFQ